MVWCQTVRKEKSMATRYRLYRHVAILAITAPFGFCTTTTLKGDIVSPRLSPLATRCSPSTTLGIGESYFKIQSIIIVFALLIPSPNFWDSSLRDLRANSGELSRIGSNNEILSSLIKQEREADNSQQIGKDDDENAAPRFQSGVLRTNCIDCLDRTNVAQYAYGLEALGRQLHAMGLTDRPKVDADSSIAAALMDMYQGMGDALAQQYGGSAAHNTVFPERQGKWKATTQSREFLKSIKRYYSNAYTDGEKQDAINLFLGYFQPQEGKPALWELDSDYYLHVSGIGDDLIPDLSFDATAVGQGTTLAPIPACREDFLRMKLTSFDKLLERTCCHIKNVRLCSETDQKSGNSGVAPDAAEIQLKSPNWLFGQRKYDDSNSASKVSSHAVSNGPSNGENEVDGLGDLSWISGVPDLNQEDIFERVNYDKL
ncbi:Phosphoinositide phosphatase sac1 [Datura stramonium]|uniref:Phosphoinositide phosphatase sac1 n=1 Tax=Datura stramonium TaxID=4076 RepID=A0ABS8RMH4_DATST|nr:Phosphoinositide phosphatase sac1 [Datura stramonium]